VFLDHRGTELRRQVGFLPPDDLLAEAGIALGKIASLHGDCVVAAEHFSRAAERSSTELAGEALYWAGIAVWRRDGRRLDTLRAEWAKLRDRFSGSGWWARADVIPPA
jgi:hypothetical protein